MAKLSEELWQEARAKWESSKKEDYVSIGKFLGVAHSTVSRRAIKEKWTKKRTEPAKKTHRTHTENAQKRTDVLNVKNDKTVVKKARSGMGRPPGVLNKATRAFKEYAGQYTEEALDRLVDIMRTSEDDDKVIRAAIEVINRGVGRPSQAVEVSGEINTIVTEKELDPIYHGGIEKMNQQKLEREKELKRLN